MYVIRKGNKYLKTREGGWIEDPTKSLGATLTMAREHGFIIGTTSKQVADEWAKKHGGEVEDFDIFGD